jgi:TolB-like protein/DNA-binding winged helix-turn-helix (wHTH) protein/tetratricopeptide (TPR) repeat protein
MYERVLPIYEFGPFRLDTGERRLTRGGQLVPLTGKAFDLLTVLVRNSGRLLRKDELMTSLWPGRIVEENNLTVTMSALRKALLEPKKGSHYVETVPGVGYRFDAVVKERGFRPVSLGRGTLSRDVSEMSKGRTDAIGSIAVLPLADTGGDADTEYISDGITESVITRLSRLPRLKVIAWSTVSRFKGRKDVDVLDTGRRLHVRALLTGRLLRIRGRLVLSVELVDMSDGTQIWGGHYSHPISDAFSVHEEIAAEVSEQLRLTLTGKEKSALTRRHTESPEAYDLYLRGRYFWNKRNEKGARKAVEFFLRATEADPDYALAYAGLADAYHLLCGLDLLAPREGHPKAKEAALTALAKDGNLVEAHASLGIIGLRYDWDWPAAERELKRAIALNPSYALARHWYAIYLCARTRFDEAIAECKRALRVDPLSLVINTLLGTHYLYAGRYDESIAQLRRTLELDPDFIYAHAALAEGYYFAGNHARAIAEVNRASELAGWHTSQALGARGYIYAAVGRAAEARALLEELERRAARVYVSAYEIGRIYVHLGEMEKALGWLNTACEQREGPLLHILSTPELSPLRSHPGFQKLARRVGINP